MTDEFESFLNLSENLSIILNDVESFNNINELFLQLNSLKNYTNIWNGKSIDI